MPRTTPSLHLAALSLGFAFSCACAAASTTPATTATPSQSAARTPQVEEPEADEEVEVPLVLARALHPAPMTEVTLDPRGKAAITLDTGGGARLWTDVHASTIEAPLVLPFREPSWVTLARASEDRLVVAALDTAGATQVGEVELADGGARWSSLFTIPPGEPLLEIHVLNGGERFLALSLDHRLRLLDRAGESVAELDSPGFVPWQLRVAHQEEGPPKLVAVLAGPVRVQPITIDGDSLEVTGEPRRVNLDRGPNRNDMILSPDGAFVTSLRRIRAKGRAWTLELIDLATDERRWIAGAADGVVRPRLHLLDPGRALLEVGSGRGHLVDLTQAAHLPGLVNRRRLAKTPTTIISVAGSTEESRMRGDLVGGTRVFASGYDLYVDPIDSGARRKISAATFEPDQVAFDPTGERLAWLSRGELRVESLNSDGPPRVLSTVEEPLTLDFVDPQHLAIAGAKGDVQLLRWSDGREVARVKAKGAWGFEVARFHRRGDGEGGAIVLTPARRREASTIVEIAGASIAAPRAFAPEDRGAWLEVRDAEGERAQVAAQLNPDGEMRGAEAIVAVGDRLYGLAEASKLIELRGDELAVLPLDHGVLPRLDPAPSHRKVALQSRPRASSPILSVAVVDLEGDSPGRRWSRTFPGVGADVAWSDDGERLALATRGGGFVVDSSTGETLFERTHLGLAVVGLPPRKAASAPE